MWQFVVILQRMVATLLGVIGRTVTSHAEGESCRGTAPAQTLPRPTVAETAQPRVWDLLLSRSLAT